MPGLVLRLAILPSVVQGTLSIEDVFEAAARSLSLRPALEVVTSSELLSGTADPLISTAAKCGSDLACIADRMSGNRIDLALRVVINHAVDPPLVSLHLVDIASVAIAQEVFAEVTGDVIADLAKLTGQLFDKAGYPEGARVRLVVSPPGADVSFPGAVKRGDLFLVPAGEHVIDVSREGYVPASQKVVVAGGREVPVFITLAEESGSVVSSPWLWLGVGAGAAAIAAIVVFVVVDPLRPDCICIGDPDGPNCPACH